MELRMWLHTCFCLFMFTGFTVTLFAQDNQDNIPQVNTEKYLKAVTEKAGDFNQHVDKYTQKTLSKLLKEEEKMKKLVMKRDSLLSGKLFNYAIDSIQKLKDIIKNKEDKVENFLRRSRLPYVDSLKKVFLFFESNASNVKSINTISANISGAKDQISGVESRLQGISKIQQFIQDRKNVLASQLKLLPELTKYVQQFRKEAFYYKAQIQQYKEILSSPEKIENLITGKLQTIPAFQKLKKQIPAPFGSMFGNKEGVAADQITSADSNKNIIGLAPRVKIQKLIQANSPGIAGTFDPMPAIIQQVDKAVESNPMIPQKVMDLFAAVKGNTLSDAGHVENDFTPNSQRVKSFWKRIDYGADLQFGKSVNYLPATTNITLKIGYKLDDKKTAGIGIGYIMGMGTGWKNIAISHQGISLKSFLKWSWKKGFALQGEAGWNYMSQFKNIEELKNNNAWQKEGLIGISKECKLTKKVKANLQFMFDLFYRTHIPYTQPTVFRFGYGF